MNIYSSDKLSRIKIKISNIIDEELQPDVAPSKVSLEETTLKGLAKRIHQARRKRNRLLPSELMGEPAWDILLDLFAASNTVSVKHIALTSDVPVTTALRWIAVLESQEFLTKEVSPCDARRANISLTDYGRERVAGALRGMQLEGLFTRNGKVPA